jgi:hypothetical protein
MVKVMEKGTEMVKVTAVLQQVAEQLSSYEKLSQHR